MERTLFRDLRKLFNKFVKVQMYLYGQYGIYDETVAERALNEDFLPMIQEHYRKIGLLTWEYNEGKYKEVKQVEEAFVLGRSVDFERLINEYATGRTLVLAGISARLSGRIRTFIMLEREQGANLDQIARAVVEEFAVFGRLRAALIARTETHNAASYANHTYHQQLADDTGIEMVKQWVAVNDPRTRSAHAEANGQKVAMDEKFDVGGAKMKYAGDPAGGAKNVINCRCVIVYANAEDDIE